MNAGLVDGSIKKPAHAPVFLSAAKNIQGEIDALIFYQAASGGAV